jgi:hypothetical protein
VYLILLCVLPLHPSLSLQVVAVGPYILNCDIIFLWAFQPEAETLSKFSFVKISRQKACYFCTSSFNPPFRSLWFFNLYCPVPFQHEASQEGKDHRFMFMSRSFLATRSLCTGKFWTVQHIKNTSVSCMGSMGTLYFHHTNLV